VFAFTSILGAIFPQLASETMVLLFLILAAGPVGPAHE